LLTADCLLMAWASAAGRHGQDAVRHRRHPAEPAAGGLEPQPLVPEPPRKRSPR
jgi:hypothetical protein